MTTFSVRCRNSKCRHRRVLPKHPLEYKFVSWCTECGQHKGWRVESRAYNKRDLCGCGQVPLYPHRKGKHKMCDFHPMGFYNQAKRRGISDDDIPLEYLGRPMKDTDDCPF